MKNKYNTLKISMIAIILGFILGFIIVIITGRSPYNMLIALIRSISGFDLSKPENGFNLIFLYNWLLDCMPIILTGLSVGFAYRTGLFNIGGEGQFMLGSTFSAFAAIYLELPLIIHLPICILAGALGGALWSFLPGFLKAYKNINEVVVCIMLNYIGLYFSNFLVQNFLPLDAFTLARSIPFNTSAILPKLPTGTSSALNYGIIVVIIALLIYWFIIEKTTFGFSLKATGSNINSAKFAGMKVKRNTVYSMMIAGALSGLAGAIVVCGVFKHGRIFTLFDNYGFDGIAVALVGAANSFGILLSGLLFGLLKACGNAFQLFNIPKEISSLIQASIIYLVAIQYGIIWIINKKDKLKLKNKESNNE